MSNDESSVYALETRAQHPYASQLWCVDLTGRLADGEDLTGTPTVTIDPADEVALSEIAVNDAVAVNGQGVDVEAFRSVLFRVANVSAPRNYVLTVECETTFGNHAVLQCRLLGQE